MNITFFFSFFLFFFFMRHLQQLLQIFVLFGEWTVIFSFYLPTFSNTLPNGFYLFFFNNYIFQWEVLYIHNILRNNFTTKFIWKIVTSSNLNPLLKLFFYSPILSNNNPLLKIYYENIMVFFILFFPSHHLDTLLLLFFSFCLFFSLGFFSITHVSHSFPLSTFFFFFF